ncbi:MAG: radical SAM protein [Candidatus Omnitrophica bacterium]|nr:radical SAM protein [Candidatus Omnitrophota bacterium]MBD3269095.1 radical SAM protein [Candidatus Omnitrophota bacterium]
MKVVFVNPVIDPHVNPGLIYVMTAVEKEHQIKLLDFAHHYTNYRSYIHEQLDFRPDVIAVTANSFSFAYGLEVTKVIKQIHPKALSIFGGMQPTLLPEETISNPLVDAICIGEGEVSLPEFLHKLQSGKEPVVEGMWFKKAGKTVKTSLRPFFPDLDKLFFPNWDHYNIEDYFATNMHLYRGLMHLISRGCPYSCSYCSEKIIREKIPGKYYRVRSPGNIIEEVKHNKRKYFHRGLRGVSLFALTFGLEDSFVEEFCFRYKQEGLHREMPWSFQTRIDKITEKKVRMVAEAGCALIAFGIESGDDMMRNQVYKKNFSREQIFKAVSLLREYNIIWSTNIIIGGPGETKMSIENSFKLLDELKPNKRYFFFYQPLPLTELSGGKKKMNFDDVCGFWNVPRTGTGKLSLSCLKRIKWKIFLEEFLRIVKKGFGLRGVLFFWDFLKFIFGVKGSRIHPLKHPYSLMELGQRKVDRLDFLNQRLVFFRRYFQPEDINPEEIKILYEDNSTFFGSERDHPS